jgi:hypothetical protein
LNVTIAQNRYGEAEVSVTDISGKKVLGEYVYLSAGENNIEFYVNDLPAGLYFLKVSASGNDMRIKFIKE